MEIPRGSSSSSEVVSNYSLDNEQKQEHFRKCSFFLYFFMKVYLPFSGEEKKAKKLPVTTTAAMSRTPQRFLVIAKLGRVAPATL